MVSNERRIIQLQDKEGEDYKEVKPTVLQRIGSVDPGQKRVTTTTNMKLQFIINTVEGRPLSPFLLAKLIQNETGTTAKEVKSTPRGYEIALTEKDADKLKGKKIGDQTIVIDKHPFKNKKKGVIYYPTFMFMTDEEILEGLKEEKVTEIDRILKKGPAKKFETGHISEKGLTNTGKFTLTFEASQIPSKLKIGMELVEVTKYIPRPIHCNQCHKWTHHSTTCKDKEYTCGKCGINHDEEECQVKEMKCPNCNGNHHARSRECDAYKDEVKAITIAVQNNIPRHEARKSVGMKTNNKTYAEITSPKTTTTATSSNLEELLQTILNQQKMLLNILITGKVAEVTTTSTTGQQANKPAQKTPSNKPQDTTRNEKQPPKQPAQEHLLNLQEQLRAEANKKRNHSPELGAAAKINKSLDTGEEYETQDMAMDTWDTSTAKPQTEQLKNNTPKKNTKHSRKEQLTIRIDPDDI